jgi:DNA-binding GntR family transcriptional regulator
MDRTDAFEVALLALRERLREGAFPAGTRVPASKIADELSLSATPVREALSRLAGEGLVEERRHQGFFVMAPTGLDIADLYRLSLALLMIAQGQASKSADPADTPASLGDLEADPVAFVESLFLRWVEEGGSTALARSYRTLSIQLGPVRRAEGAVLDALDAEAKDLLAAANAEGSAQRGALLRRFHGRRIAVADRLSAVINRRNRRE